MLVTKAFQIATTSIYNQPWNRINTPRSVELHGYTDGGGNKPYDRRRTNNNNGGEIKSKRQERVAQIVKTEISQIIHTGLIKGVNAEYLDDELRTRISVVNTDVSPDLRQARISISVRPTPRNTMSQQITNDNDGDDEDDTDNDDDDDDVEEDDDAVDAGEVMDADNNDVTNSGISNLQDMIMGQQQQQQRQIGKSLTSTTSPSVDRRRAYAWLVRNTKSIRYTLAQRMSHMKSCPDLTFVQVDVSAAVDVMYLIDKLSSTDGKFKRDNLNLFSDDDDDVARGMVGGLDFDAIDDDDWDEEDDSNDTDFVNTK